MEPKETKKEAAPRSPKSAPAKKPMAIDAETAPSLPKPKPANKYAPKGKIRPTFGNVTTTTH